VILGVAPDARGRASELGEQFSQAKRSRGATAQALERTLFDRVNGQFPLPNGRKRAVVDTRGIAARPKKHPRLATGMVIRKWACAGRGPLQTLTSRRREDPTEFR